MVICDVQICLPSDQEVAMFGCLLIVGAGDLPVLKESMSGLNLINTLPLRFKKKKLSCWLRDFFD